MELFARAKVVRLKSHHDKFLYADEDEVHVTQDRNGASPNARWSVEAVPQAPGVVRLRSRYGRYLTASNEPFLLGMTGRKVLQTAPARPDSSVEWEPVRDGFQTRLKTRYGHFLRANGGLPPWRNSVTHDVPHRTATQDWVLWDVEVVQVLTPGPERAESAPVKMPDSPPAPEIRDPPPPRHRPSKSYAAPPPPPPTLEPEAVEARPAPRLSKLERDVRSITTLLMIWATWMMAQRDTHLHLMAATWRSSPTSCRRRRVWMTSSYAHAALSMGSSLLSACNCHRTMQQCILCSSRSPQKWQRHSHGHMVHRS
ncbi:hypothetical protein SEVIR_9G050100v4 [Setaria viridis]